MKCFLSVKMCVLWLFFLVLDHLMKYIMLQEKNTSRKVLLAKFHKTELVSRASMGFNV